MSQSPTLSTIPQAPTTPCPPWCRHDTCQPELGAQHHHGEHHTYLDVDGQCPQELLVSIGLLIEPGEVDTLYVTIAAREPGEDWDELHPDVPLSVAGAAWLGATLSKVAAEAIPAQRDSEPPQILPGALDRWGQGVGTIICVDCGSEFHPDSSPHLDRCWICAELADVQAGVEL